MTAPLPCIICGLTPKPLADPKPRDHGPAQPVGALWFTSRGQHGSDFDPMDGSLPLVCICDECLKVRARPEYGQVWHRRYRPSD